jgi:hypothetical protein
VRPSIFHAILVLTLRCHPSIYSYTHYTEVNCTQSLKPSWTLPDNNSLIQQATDARSSKINTMATGSTGNCSCSYLLAIVLAKTTYHRRFTCAPFPPSTARWGGDRWARGARHHTFESTVVCSCADNDLEQIHDSCISPFARSTLLLSHAVFLSPTAQPIQLMHAFLDARPLASAESILLVCMHVGTHQFTFIFTAYTAAMPVRTKAFGRISSYHKFLHVQASGTSQKERLTTTICNNSERFPSTVQHNVVQLGHEHGRHGSQRTAVGAQVLSIVFTAKR